MKVDQVISHSEASLLDKLNITPFAYGMKVLHVYDDGTMLDPEILEMTKQDYSNKFQEAVRNIRAISMATGYHTEASNKSVLLKGFKNILAMGLNLGYEFNLMNKLKEGAEQQ